MKNIFNLTVQETEDWIEALRSGQYRQGYKQLKTVGAAKRSAPAFCCLGVLCDIQMQKRDDMKWDEEGSLIMHTPHSYNRYRGTLPYNFMEDRIQSGLARRNDGCAFLHEGPNRKWTFGEIADLIERNKANFTKELI